MPEPSPTWALIAGGGTAGHTLPGIAVARALVAAGHPAESIHFVGSERGSETRLVPEAGFTLTALPGRGIQRKLTFANVGAVVGLVRAFGQALALVRRRRPSVVVALGGYASVACAMAAVLHRIPIVVAEQNAVPGAANRLVARFARASAVTFPGTDLPRAVVTGNPVRPEVLAVDRDRDRGPARARLGLPDDRVVVVAFGGSLGARRINRAVTGVVERWAGRTDLAVRHVVGERDWDDGTARGEERNGASGILYRPVRYEDDMPTTLAAADVVVARAGATTVAELAVARAAQHPRAAAHRHRRPPDGQRAPPRRPGCRSPRARCRAGRRSARGRARRRWWPIPTSSPGWAPARAGWAPTPPSRWPPSWRSTPVSSVGRRRSHAGREACHA